MRCLLAFVASVALALAGPVGAQPMPCPAFPALTCDGGAMVRGPRDGREIALVFTGDEYAEAAPSIVQTLAQRRIPATFFLTGRFVRAHAPLVRRLHRAGHVVGPHSDRHLLYASWDAPPRLLVSRDSFDADLRANIRALTRLGLPRPTLFLPPYEHYTRQIAGWTDAHGLALVNLTRGTRSATDYMTDADPAFVPAEAIVRSVLDRERADPDGLSGYLLLMHVGAGPGRTRDALAPLLGGMLDSLSARGYRFVRLDRLLDRSG